MSIILFRGGGPHTTMIHWTSLYSSLPQLPLDVIHGTCSKGLTSGDPNPPPQVQTSGDHLNTYGWQASCTHSTGRFFTTRNEVGARLCFYMCLWFCSQGVVWVDIPLEQTPPPGTPSWENTPMSSACWEIRPTSGRYASYWNAILFFFILLFDIIVDFFHYKLNQQIRKYDRFISRNSLWQLKNRFCRTT